MTVYSRTIRLQITPKEAQRYIPTKGLNVKWHKWNRQHTEAVVEIIAADTYIYPNEAQDRTLIDYEVDVRLASRVLKGNIPNPNNQKTMLVSKYPSTHPLLKLNLPKSKQDDFKKLEQMEIRDAGLRQINKNIIELSRLDKRLRQMGLADQRIKPLKRNYKTHSSIVELATLENQ